MTKFIADRALPIADQGLSEDGGTQMPSFVCSVPDGSETGAFLAVDLGGTNCRICLVQLEGNGTYDMVQSKWPIPKDCMVNMSYEPLFNFIATNIKTFIHENTDRLSHESLLLQLGFTFSFTFVNTSLSSGKLLQWDKGWDIPSAIGKDPVVMLQDAINRQELPVKVAALTNDSVGTLMARSYTSSNQDRGSSTLLGVILGTGTNAAYYEKQENIKRLGDVMVHEQTPGSAEPAPLMAVNTEWGAMGDDNLNALGSSASRFDWWLDSASSSPDSQLLEKRVSGLYLGELVRLAVVHLLDEKLLEFKPAGTKSPLLIPYAVDTGFLSDIAFAASKMEDGSISRFDAPRVIIEERLGVTQASNQDARAILLIGDAIVRRSGHLIGAAVGAVVLQSGRLTEHLAALEQGKQRHLDDDSPRVDVGFDGSLIEKYWYYEELIREGLRKVPGVGVEGEKLITIDLAKDGSSLGAALAAHSAAKSL